MDDNINDPNQHQESAPLRSPEDEQQRTQRMDELIGSASASKKSRRWVKVLLVMIVVVIVAGGAGAYYWFFVRSPQSQPSNSSEEQAKQSQAAEQPKTDTTQTAHYDSENFGLGFDYPKSWTVSDKRDDRLTITSDVTDLKDGSGQKMPGQIVVTILPKQKKLPEFEQGNAIAVLRSEKIAYTNPTDIQREQTYLSYLQYAATTDQGVLDGVYITGDYGYKKGQAVPESDVVKVDPLVKVNFLACQGPDCTQTEPASIPASFMGETEVSKPIKALLASLNILE